MSLSFFHHSL